MQRAGVPAARAESKRRVPAIGTRVGSRTSAGLRPGECGQCGALAWAPGHAGRGRPRGTWGLRSGALAGTRPAPHSAPSQGAQRRSRESSAGQGGVPASGECARAPLAAAARCPAGHGSRIPAAEPEGEAAPPPHRPRTTRRMRAPGARRVKERGDRRAAIADRGHPRGQSRQPCAPRDPCRLRPPVHNSPGGAARGAGEPRALAPGAPRVLIGAGTRCRSPHPAPPFRVTVPGGPSIRQGLRPQRGMRSAPKTVFVGNKDLWEKD